MSLPFDHMYKTPGDKKTMKKDGFFTGFGAKAGKVAKAAGRGFVKSASSIEKSAQRIGKSAKEGYREAKREGLRAYDVAGKVNVKHRQRVIARETFKTFKLEQKVARNALKQQLPPGRKQRIKNIDKSYGGPLSDRQSKGLSKRISTGRGGPLSDFKPKPKMDSNESFDKFISGKGGV